MSLLWGGGGKATMPPTPTGLGNEFSLHEIHQMKTSGGTMVAAGGEFLDFRIF